ncbi:S1 RNA-binding domain-containing protein [Catellatospora sp. NEAU-YM18]|nr:S1 RNA-binding domain-containing protein [Catellatospora tritici]
MTEFLASTVMVATSAIGAAVVLASVVSKTFQNWLEKRHRVAHLDAPLEQHKDELSISVTDSAGTNVNFYIPGTDAVDTARAVHSGWPYLWDLTKAEAARSLPKRGDRYVGTVVWITESGALIELLPGRIGILHISKVGGGKRVLRVEDFLNLGDEIEVEIADVDSRGKIYLDKVLSDDERSAPGRPEAPDRPASRRRADRGPRSAAGTGRDADETDQRGST